MIYIDLDADLNMEDDTGRNFTLVTAPATPPQVGTALVAGRPSFWSWAVIDEIDATSSTSTKSAPAKPPTSPTSSPRFPRLSERNDRTKFHIASP
jgi:hypothetical protein